MAKVNDAQQFGAAVTYARRYGLVGALNVPVDDEDDDAACLTENTAEPAEQPVRANAKPKKPAPAVRGGNPFGIPPHAWLKLDAVQSADELLRVCGDFRDEARRDGWAEGANRFYADRKSFLDDLTREVMG
jgi:hypothetical protein